MSGNGVISRRPPNSAQGGDSIGSARAQSVLPIRRRDLGMLSDIHAADLERRAARKLVAKWHDGFGILEMFAYHGYWIVRIAPISEEEPSWLAAVDVDVRTRKAHRVRGIGTHNMAFLHKKREDVERTIERYHSCAGPAA